MFAVSCKLRANAPANLDSHSIPISKPTTVNRPKARETESLHRPAAADSEDMKLSGLASNTAPPLRKQPRFWIGPAGALNR